MFEHSVKVPRHYKIAANIVKKASTEGGSVKNLLYEDKLRHFRTNVLFALITETIKHASDLDKIFENCNILKTESRLDPWLAKVLVTELLFGKKSLPGKSKPEQTVLSYKEQFEKYIAENQDHLSKNEVVRRPRYVRINTNLLSTSDAIRAFQDEGYRFVRCTSSSYDDYLKQIQNLTEYDFTQDYHVKTVFVFSAGTKMHEHELYLENKIILQDKATTLAVHLLSPPSGSIVLDMCAAPGMKTTQLAAYMRNEGKVYAVERNENRYRIMCDFVEKTGCKCVEAIHKDALEIKRGDYSDVEYILLDPSCSGSGMELSVHNYIDPNRLAKLTSLQEKFLKHAMNAFPKAKRIVYSTCSLYPEENERVISNVVKTSRAKWRVQDVKELLKGQWNNIGSGMYGSMGMRCIYAKPESDFTTGFFLAVLDRDQQDLEKNANNESKVDEFNRSSKDMKVKPEHNGKFADCRERNVCKENMSESNRHNFKHEKEEITASNENKEVDMCSKKKHKNKKDKIKSKMNESIEVALEENVSVSCNELRESDIINVCKENMSESNRHNFKHEKEEITASNENKEVDMCSKKKHKNKKDKIKSKMNESIEVALEENHSVSCNELRESDIMKNKKKDQLNQSDSELNTVHVKNNNVEITKIKRKKNKKRKKEKENNTEQGDECNDVVINNNTSLDIKEFKEDDNDVQPVRTALNEYDVSSVKKKKKVKRTIDNESDFKECSTKVCDTDEKMYRKNNKERKRYRESDKIEEVNMDEMIPNKKKKINKEIKDDISNSTSLYETEKRLSKKKDKKTERCIEIGDHFEEDNLVYCETFENLPKKKKSKNLQRCSRV